MKNFKIKNIVFPLLLVTMLTLLFSACKKDNLDDSDPNVYQWEVIYYRYPLIPNSNGAPEYDFTLQMIEYNRDKLSLTNKQVNEMKKKASKHKEMRIEVRKL